MIAQLYAHILLFFQQAMRWYNRSPAGRAFSAIFKPYELHYQDAAEQIKTCAQAVNDLASAASRTEIRDINITIQLMRRDSHRREEKLLQMQTQLQETQRTQLRMEKSVHSMLQIATSAQSLSLAIRNGELIAKRRPQSRHRPDPHQCPRHDASRTRYSFFADPANSEAEYMPPGVSRQSPVYFQAVAIDQASRARTT